MPPNGFIQMLARPTPEDKVFVIKPQGQYADKKNPLLDEDFKKKVANEHVRVTSLVPRSPDHANRQCVATSDNPNGPKFREVMQTSSGTLFIEESPEKKSSSASTTVQGEVRFAGIPSLDELRRERPELFLDLKTESFQFILTEKMIHERSGQRRPRSQTQVVGYSAAEIFLMYGVVIAQKVKKITMFHHAHRQAWSFFGSQSKDNLDPSTAGSNYHTLFNIESPLKYLIVNDKVPFVKVQGTVIFHPLLPFPMEVQYVLTWGNGRVAKISTFPLEYRSPTLSEHQVATAVIQSLITPEKVARPKSDDDDDDNEARAVIST